MADRLYNALVLGMEIFIMMEHTTKASAFNLSKIKAVRVAALMIFAWLISRGVFLDGYFPAAVAFVAYMVRRKRLDIWLVIPAAAGILPYFRRGYEPWGDLAAVILCGILFAVSGRIKLETWQTAAISASAGIICTSVSRLVTAAVYEMSVKELLLYGLLIFVFVFVFDTLWEEKGGVGVRSGRTVGRRGQASRASSRTAVYTAGELRAASLVSVSLLLLNGLGLSFLSWPVVLFLAMAALAYLDPGTAFLTVAIGGIWTGVTGQGQWGLMATAVIGVAAAALAGKKGGFVPAAVLIFTCWALGMAESGVVLGADNYCLLLSGASFLAVNWKFGGKLEKFIATYAGKEKPEKAEAGTKAAKLLKARVEDMEDLSELYSTYLDSRSVVAGQFDVTRQIMEDIRRRISGSARTAGSRSHEKFEVDISVAQCAAAGDINGDCCGWQDIGDGKVAMIVSDGMGKGKKAAAESLMVTKTIISLLRSGVTTDLTLKMVNAVMLMKEDEDSYATVDLAIVDKCTGKTKFYKIGAAPTLIRRKDKVEEVKLSAVPLGIVNGLKVRYVETVLKKDDWIIMMSDGVSDGGVAGGGGRSDVFLSMLKETAAGVRSTDTRTMSDLILNRAADSYIGKERDDLTVLVARLS